MARLPLSKQLTFGAIVGGVAFVTSALLATLTAAAGARAPQGGTPPWFIGLILGAAAGSFYLLLSGNRKMPLADKVERQRALAGPDAGRAQLLVVREGFVGKLAGVDVLVDGVSATQLKSPRFAALSLAPGRHAVMATVQGKSTPAQVVDLESGETAVLRIDMAIGRAKLTRESDVQAMRRRLETVPMVRPAVTA